MEFENRKKCVEHYLGEYPNLPRYMIEMALDYDLAQGDGVSNEKPLTGKQKRKLKKAKQEHEPVERELNRTIQDALKSGKPLEIDCATIVRGDEYVMHLLSKATSRWMVTTLCKPPRRSLIVKLRRRVSTMRTFKRLRCKSLNLNVFPVYRDYGRAQIIRPPLRYQLSVQTEP
jgi:hypothetical protein